MRDHLHPAVSLNIKWKNSQLPFGGFGILDLNLCSSDVYEVVLLIGFLGADAHTDRCSESFQ